MNKQKIGKYGSIMSSDSPIYGMYSQKSTLENSAASFWLTNCSMKAFWMKVWSKYDHINPSPSLWNSLVSEGLEGVKICQRPCGVFLQRSTSICCIKEWFSPFEIRKYSSQIPISIDFSVTWCLSFAFFSSWLWHEQRTMNLRCLSIFAVRRSSWSRFNLFKKERKLDHGFRTYVSVNDVQQTCVLEHCEDWTRKLRAAGVPEPQTSAEFIIAHAIGKKTVNVLCTFKYSSLALSRLVVNGATGNAQCATFLHFKFIAFTLQGLP